MDSNKKMTNDEIQHVEQHQPRTIHDRAAEVLQHADHTVTLTEENNRRVLRKIDRNILPLILVVYMLQFVDKVSRLGEHPAPF